MAEFRYSLKANAALDDAEVRVGDNCILERTDLAIVSAAIPMEGRAKFADALKAGWSLEMPTDTVSTTHQNARAMMTASDQLFLLFSHEGTNAIQGVEQTFADKAYLTDQSDVWAAIEINGPDVLAALERLCPIDVAMMAVDGSARTMMEHMGAMIVRTADQGFLLFSARSSARSFFHAVVTSFENVVP